MNLVMRVAGHRRCSGVARDEEVQPPLSPRRAQADVKDESPWRFDFTTVLVLLLALVFLPLITFELWIPHH
jgi:hypothetical protein